MPYKEQVQEIWSQCWKYSTTIEPDEDFQESSGIPSDKQTEFACQVIIDALRRLQNKAKTEAMQNLLQEAIEEYDMISKNAE